MAVHHFPQGHRFGNYLEYQSHYMDQKTGTLLPSTELWRGEKLWMRINSLGCKGPELVQDLPVLGCFGCSTTFGHGQGYPAQLEIPGCQILNAAVEGYSMERALERFKALRQEVCFSGVIAYLGWHNLIYNQQDEAFWREILEGFDGPHLMALCTLGTCLLPECRQRGLDALLRPESQATFDPEMFDGEYFNFWGGIPPSPERVAEILDAIERYNRFARALAREKNWLLIDLYQGLLPESYEAMPREFFDICHPRPSAYQRIAEFMSGVIRMPMARHLAMTAAQRLPASPMGSPAAGRAPEAAARKAAPWPQLYPLW